MMHPDSKAEFVDEQRGTRVISTCSIPKGTLVWIPGETDQVFSVQQVSVMPEDRKAYLAEYSYLTNAGTYIVSNDMSRFVNHSCNANSLSVAGLEISIAVRDIQEGEEISEEYGLYYANGGFETCTCGSPDCRQKITKDDVWRYGDDWDRKIEAGFKLLPTVKQPLWEYITPSTRKMIESILTGQIACPSCKTLLCSLDYLENAGELLWPATERN